jgi:uncharacterized protein YggE
MKRAALSPVRLLAVMGAAVAIFAFGGWMSANAGTPTTSGAASSVSWCCLDGSSPGITVTGDATVHGRGTTARDDAIARAVADATDQANAAAHAAGITLGNIVDMQVSASPYPYAVPDMPVGISGGSPGSGAESGSSSGASSASAIGCSPTALCAPVAVAVPFQSYASVTITWSIA